MGQSLHLGEHRTLVQVIIASVLVCRNHSTAQYIVQGRLLLPHPSDPIHTLDQYPRASLARTRSATAETVTLITRVREV